MARVSDAGSSALGGPRLRRGIFSSGGLVGFLLFASLAIALILSNAPRHYRYFSPVPPTCIHCKYDLSGSIGAHSCPECGLDWHSATSRREASSPYAVDRPRAGRALLAWAALILFAILSRPIAIALVALNYYTSGFRNINFINVALNRELNNTHPMTITPLTSLAFLILPSLFARSRGRLGLKLILIAIIIDTILWAIPHAG